MRVGVGRALVASCVAALTLGGVVACGGGSLAPTATQTAHRAQVKQAPPEVPPTWPLSGEVGDVVERAAVSIKVDNERPARPQTGLEQADLVWEEMIEGGETRFIAVYNSMVPEVVGPVRSVRPMDGPILGAVRGILVASGGQDRFLREATDAELQVLTEDYKGFFRSGDRSMPHNLYVRPAEIWEQADPSHKALPLGEFHFAASPAAATAFAEGTDATQIDVVISAVAAPGWTFQPESRLYLRSERGNASHSASGVRLSAANVVILAVPVVNASGTDAAGSPIPDTKIVGSGRGLVAAGGKAIEVTWSKESVAAPVALRTADGSDVRLTVGQTWIELVPADGGSWTVTAS